VLPEEPPHGKYTPQLTDPLHLPGDPGTHWSTVNVGEALPGVATPLGWSIWADIGDQMCRDLSWTLGVFDARERRQPPPGPDRIITAFYGRIAMRMEWMALVGDRMPGTTGAGAIVGMLGEAPPTMEFRPTRRRYPVIAHRLPRAGLTSARRVRRLAPEVDAWWRHEVLRVPALDLPDATAAFAGAADMFARAMTVHAVGLFAAITPLVNALNALVERTGVGDVGVLSGTGGAEMRMVEDIWRASRGELSVDRVVAAHGYHGPLEGEISSRVWRENPKPLAVLVERYATRDASASPLARERETRARLPGMQRALLAELPAPVRPPVRALLAHAARTIPLRGLGKASFLQALDAARAAARRIGEHHALAGRLDEPGDVFYLTVPELLAGCPAGARELVAFRRERREEYQGLRLPSFWRGTPDPERVTADAPDETAPGDATSGDATSGDTVSGGTVFGDTVFGDTVFGDTAAGEPAPGETLLTGIAAGSGVVEGLVRVVHDPDFTDVEPGEVLVAPTTDPSWASIMFVSAALVVDIGSVLSHAAVVARELGLPCVVNTGVGTRVLRDGDLVRVDGTAGTVEILRRAGR
jgi:pyruvate,water dikinase